MKTMHAMAGRLVFVLILSWTPLLPAQQGNLRDHAHFHGDVAYAEVGPKTLKLDLYVPRDTQGKHPCVVWIHGGAWRAGNKRNPRVAWLTQHGYVVASIQYRLSQDAIFPAQIHDCKGAIRWLRAHASRYAMDADRIGVAGSSAGGHLAALLGTSADVQALEGQTGGHLDQPSRVQAVLDMFGPTDFASMNAHAYPGSTLDHDAADSPESMLIGGPVQENPDKVARANPMTYISRDDPPFLILHGDRDKLVPHHQSELLAAALKDSDVPASLHTVQGAGHGWPRTEARNERVRAFFDKHLKRHASPARSGPPYTYVIVHGAWGGGWAFKEVERLLRADGHAVYRPTLTGQGEKVHLAHPDINLSTHIQDIANVIVWEQLTDIVLVGHSYGGMVITGVMDRVPERIQHAVYLDALLPEDGESLHSAWGRSGLELRETNGFIIPAWVKEDALPPHDVPHPAKTLSEPISLQNPGARNPAATYILTVDTGRAPQEDDFYPFLQRAESRGWTTWIMEGDHNVQWSRPQELVTLLEKAP